MNDIKKFIEYSALSIGIELDPNGFGEDGSWCWMLDGNDVWQPLISEAQFMMLLSKLRLDIKHEPDLLSNGLGTVTVRPHSYSGIAVCEPVTADSKYLRKAVVQACAHLYEIIHKPEADRLARIQSFQARPRG